MGGRYPQGVCIQGVGVQGVVIQGSRFTQGGRYQGVGILNGKVSRGIGIQG